jgi:predicted SAM-dependent methyltransferase
MISDRPLSALREAVRRVPVIAKPAAWLLFQGRCLASVPAWRRLRRAPEIRLELGSWRKRGTAGWTTIDLGGADITHDLRRPLPLPAASVDEIYSSHTFEHFHFPDLMALLRECHRVLKPGCTLSVCVPDVRPYIDAYIAGTQYRDPSGYFGPARVETGSAIDQVNYIAYMGGDHKYMFDRENQINTLRASGFEACDLRDFDPRLDRPERRDGSIYAVARK